MNKEKAMRIVEDIPCTPESPDVMIKEVKENQKLHYVKFKKNAEGTTWEYAGVTEPINPKTETEQ
jgi:hypothetical protein